MITYDLGQNKLSAGGEHPIRPVDLNSGSYEVALKYQIRLKKSDFADPELMKKIAEICHTNETAFIQEFEGIAT